MRSLVRQRTFWAGILAGIIVGLIVGWGVWPVRYTDAYPSELREQDRLEFLLLVARDYDRTGDVAALARRLRTFDQKDLVPSFEQALGAYSSSDDRRALRHTLETIRSSLAASASGTHPTSITPTPTPRPSASAPAGGGFRRVLGILVIALGAAVLLIALVRVLQMLRTRRGSGEPASPDWIPAPEPPRPEPLDMAADEEPEAEPEPVTTVQMPRHLEREEGGGVGGDVLPASTEPAAAPSLRLVEMFSPVFMLQATGEEGYDEGFTIYEGKENLGECGVGEAESLDDHAGKPTVMEIWLFDKRDPDTHQAYVLSPWAYRQPDIRQKYEDQGPVFEGRHGTVIRLNARALHLEAEIKDVAYAQLGQGDEVFSKLALEMKVYRRIMPRS